MYPAPPVTSAVGLAIRIPGFEPSHNSTAANGGKSVFSEACGDRPACASTQYPPTQAAFACASSRLRKSHATAVRVKRSPEAPNVDR